MNRWCATLLLFDIGANKGDATQAGLNLGYKVIAIEPSRMYGELAGNFINNPNVTPLKYAVSDSDFQTVEFYEADEDGLSTLNKDWLTAESMPYAGKPFRTIQVLAITMDTLVKKHGKPDLTKIDVEGGEWNVFRGMTQHYGELTFEWTLATLDQHQEQLAYLSSLGYTEVAPQFIVHHLQRPATWYGIDLDVRTWQSENAPAWESHEWKNAGLRPTADVGMIWVR